MFEGLGNGAWKRGWLQYVYIKDLLTKVCSNRQFKFKALVCTLYQHVVGKPSVNCSVL